MVVNYRWLYFSQFRVHESKITKPKEQFSISMGWEYGHSVTDLMFSLSSKIMLFLFCHHTLFSLPNYIFKNISFKLYNLNWFLKKFRLCNLKLLKILNFALVYSKLVNIWKIQSKNSNNFSAYIIWNVSNSPIDHFKYKFQWTS